MKKLYLPFLVFGITAFLVGCNLPSPTACAPGELVAPALNSPAMWAVVDSLSPTLTWESTDSSVPYPYDSCFPTGYHISLNMAPYPADRGGDNYGGHNLDWTPTSPLEPGSEYHWSVRAFAPSGNGPYADERVFFTGPMCATSALVAPNLLTPPNGTIVTTLNPLLTWDYPNPCLPQGYRIDLSTESSFTDTSLSGGTGNPSTRWLPGTNLTDCTLYYWRVAAGNDTTLGPFSITKNFFVNTGSCLYPIPDLPLVPLVTIPPDLLLPEFTLEQNGNCRFGPSQVYSVKTAFLTGEVLPVEGRNDQSSWLYVRMPDTDHCWISLVNGKFNGDLSLLPFITPPPTPTLVPAPTDKPTKVPGYSSCSDYPTQDICKQDPEGFGCYWGQNNSCVSGKP